MRERWDQLEDSAFSPPITVSMICILFSLLAFISFPLGFFCLLFIFSSLVCSLLLSFIFLLIYFPLTFFLLLLVRSRLPSSHFWFLLLLPCFTFPFGSSCFILSFTFLYLLPSYVFVCLFSFSSPLSFQTFHFLFSFTHVLLLSPSFHFPISFFFFLHFPPQYLLSFAILLLLFL